MAEELELLLPLQCELVAAVGMLVSSRACCEAKLLPFVLLQIGALLLLSPTVWHAEPGLTSVADEELELCSDSDAL